MKTGKKDLLTVVLFLGFLSAMSISYFLLPEKTFSETEKRFLAESPELTWDAVSSGAWGNEVETYMADHIPGRNFFVGLNAYFEFFTGRQAGKDIWVADDRLVEAPVSEDPAAIRKNMDVINRFAATVGQSVDLMIIPSAGWATGDSAYQDEPIIQSIYDSAAESIRPVPVTDIFFGQPQLYYHTDHHWNSAGAYAAYVHYMTFLERSYQSEEAFQKNVYGPFQGSTYSRSALWLTKAEELELWIGSDNLTVINGENPDVHDGVFFWDRLKEADKYTVFLDGNHSLVRIQNPDADGRLLVIRDSYSNSLGCFLAESYAEVVLVDLRYYKQPISQLAAEESFDDILVCYSISNFLTDTNLIWLR